LESDITSILATIPIIEELSQESRAKIASDYPCVALSAGTPLCKQGDSPTHVYVLLRGALNIVITSLTQEPLTTGRVSAPDIAGEMQLLSAHPRMASLIASSDCEVLSIPRGTAVEIIAAHPSALKALTTLVRARSRHNRCLSVLSKLLGWNDPELLLRLERSSRWCSLERGQALFREGEDAASMFIVMTGRLQVRSAGEDNRELGDAVAGDVLGEMAVLGTTVRSATAVALRYSELLELSVERFDELSARHSALGISISRLLSKRLHRMVTAGDLDRDEIRTVAVMPAGSDVSIDGFCERLTSVLATHGTSRRLHPDHFTEDLGGARLGRMSDEDPQFIRLSSLLDDCEELNHFVIYQTDTEASPWTKRCIERADLILMVGSSTATPVLSDCEALLEHVEADTGVHTQRFLVIRHPSATTVPTGTSQWLSRRRVDLFLHCRLDNDADMERVARYLAGRAVGIVLGGGGARGLAHIGVLKALLESGIPIDMVGGASSGGMVAGSFAQGLSISAIIEDARKVFLETRPLNSFTVPFLSLLDPTKLDIATRRSFGDIAIEDLWIPYFCVSCNLTTADTAVHRTGSLWRAIRATTALPGLSVPMVKNGELLVDGGVIENIPVKTMTRLKRGPTIVVDVSHQGNELTVACDYEDLPSGWRLLWNHLNPFSTFRKPFNILQVISRVATVTSAKDRSEVRKSADLIIEPPVSDFGLLEWDAIDTLVELGYQSTLETLKNEDIHSQFGITRGTLQTTRIDRACD
jgi:predicted acylesterase/phospholipase RssA/CRP-like cAMP-binding protein